MIDLPSFESSRLAQERATEAAPGELTLQRCRDCGKYQYPVRELCQDCLSASLYWCRARGSGTTVATACVHASMHPFFLTRAMAHLLVVLEVGPRVIAHASDGAIESGARVEVCDIRVGPTHCVLVAKMRTCLWSRPESA